MNILFNTSRVKAFVILNKEGEGRMIPFEMKSGIGMGNFLENC